ncbi:putative lipoprotein YiaD precursor [Pseudobythopirellula maris]|uniref:Putative lipoprotein YiaD n=2 Tax=Pseudobythopirellula maris TaxID=2527991 RepID=A0A5C5ZHJ9_9BACT|nr:putative lipoprotein YiaD precursor [Pseudobythopirellula maris]
MLLAAALLPILSGCGRVVFRPDAAQQAQALQISPEQQRLLAQQQLELQQRTDALDRDNQELESLLAQSRQQAQLLRDQIVATQGQLKATADRLAATQQDNSQLKQKTEALVASVSQPAQEYMRPNSTLMRPLELRNLPGVDARQDGDVIRVALSSDELFAPGGASLTPGGEQLLRGALGSVLTAYPQHLIGIEGHTDGAPVASAHFPTSHHLSIAQATAVYDAVRRGASLPANQVFLIGHGANHPRVSNATEAGRKQNRRIELVIYPETAPLR